jgi:uncharacterized membrane protein YhiD involved in acid resistance
MKFPETIQDYNFFDSAERFFVSLVLSLVLRLVFIKFSSAAASRRRETADTLPFITLVITLLIMLIHSSFALGLGVIGSMSIIRFRTPIRNTEELIYLFFAIAIGIGVGAGEIELTMLGGGIILLVLVASSLIRRPYLAPHSVHISLRWTGDYNTISLQEIKAKLLAISSGLIVQRIETGTENSTILFHVNVPANETLSEFVQFVSTQYPAVKVVVIDNTELIDS